METAAAVLKLIRLLANKEKQVRLRDCHNRHSSQVNVWVKNNNLKVTVSKRSPCANPGWYTVQLIHVNRTVVLLFFVLFAPINIKKIVIFPNVVLILTGPLTQHHVN